MIKITVIGAGIGGLTAAIALKTKGLEVELFEAAKEIKPVGAGIILANNAMQVFEKLELSNELFMEGEKVSFLKIADPNLKPLSTVDLRPYERKYGTCNLAIHRGKLQQLLASKLDLENIHLGKRLAGITHGEEIHLEFEKSKDHRTNVLIGADGINSKVRESLFGKIEIRDSQQICWRGISNMKQPFQHELIEAWGPGCRFGFVNIAPEKVYWYALKSKGMPQGLNELFVGFHPLVQEIIQNTPKSGIHESTILDLKPMDKWYKANTCLLGDAAHATTPNLGQGACQAIEDAYMLSSKLAAFKNHQEAFRSYQEARLFKANKVIRRSYALGKIAHWENRMGIYLRNKVLQYTPTTGQMDWLFSMEY